MAKGKSDISNFAIRVFLQKVGHLYDELRGREPFKPTRTQWEEVVKFFDQRCCYCDNKLTPQDATEDHLIPLNKSASGLHAWGNVVPCCASCNKAKHGKSWEMYLESICKSKADYANKMTRIKSFQATYAYNPNLEIGSITANLYEDVGAIAMTLVDLRFKQAEKVIHEMLKRD